MSAFEARTDFGNASHEEARWMKLNATHGGMLEARAREIRSGPVKITATEARIAVLAELLHHDCFDTANVLGVDEHAIANHRSDIRRKMGKPRKEIDFDMLFYNYPPPSEFTHRNGTK